MQAEKNEIQVSLSPNPAEDYVLFELTYPYNAIETWRIEITTVTGAIVYSSSIPLNRSIKVDLSHLSGGTYLYMVQSNRTFKSGKLKSD